MTPPFLQRIWISRKSTFRSTFGSIIVMTLSTAKGERMSLQEATTLEHNDVETHYINCSLSSSLMGTEF
jgi:hypothetical protein